MPTPSEISSLVTDRTEQDVRNKTAKGVYQASDLNRVGTAMEYLQSALHDNGYTVDAETKTDWQDSEWMDTTDAEQYLSNVQKFHDVLPLGGSASVPASMNNLTFHGANDIETILYNLYQVLTSIQSASTIRQAGTPFMISGGVFNV